MAWTFNGTFAGMHPALQAVNDVKDATPTSKRSLRERIQNYYKDGHVDEKSGVTIAASGTKDTVASCTITAA